MKLRVMDRLVLFGVLPTSANFATWGELRALKRVLILTDEEKKDLNFQVSPDGNRFTWTPEKDVGRDFSISAEGLKLIQDGFKKLDTNSALTEEQATVMEKFMDAKAEV